MADATLHNDGKDHWLVARRDSDTGIEVLRAHFKGHAYDSHDHDEMLIGYTEQGIQRFQCNQSSHTSMPGRAILIEPGALHDGHAPEPNGFTYAMLYLPQNWVECAARQLNLPGLQGVEAAFNRTLVDDGHLVVAIRQAFSAIYNNEGRLARDQALDQLLRQLSQQLRQVSTTDNLANPLAVIRIRDLLNEQMSSNLGLDELAAEAGIDRFRLTRLFKMSFGTSPHAYLVRLRLRAARRLLIHGHPIADIAAAVGFADQSHFGRWFYRAYRMTPAAYRRMCTNVPD